MKIADDVPSALSALDRPNSYIGRSVPRPNLARLTQGRAQYVSDVTLPRMAHVAFVRSPYAHARIEAVDTAAARKAPGVIAVVTGAELATVIRPMGTRCTIDCAPRQLPSYHGRAGGRNGQGRAGGFCRAIRQPVP